MQSTEGRNRADGARRLAIESRRTHRDPLLQALMRSARVEVGDVLAKCGLEVTQAREVRASAWSLDVGGPVDRWVLSPCSW